MERITLTTLQWAPPTFQGQVRDLAVRWALEEIGARYEVNLVGDQQRQTAAYLAMNPFGKVPVLEVDGLVMFESGAIVQYIAEHSWLLPADGAPRARSRSWMFAALNSVDPEVIALGDIDHFAAEEDWAKVRRPQLVALLNQRLQAVACSLGDGKYLAGDFGAADILMIMVLRGLRHTTLVTDIPALRVYRDRCESRPAFQRALHAQLQTFARRHVA